MTAREIAERFASEFPDECDAKINRSSRLESREDLIQQLVAEIGNELAKETKKCRELKVTEDSPRKFYFSEQPASTEEASVKNRDEAAVAIQPPDGGSVTEQELYPILCEYLYNGLKVYPKRIDERRSSNRRGSGGNHWLHPDVVGFQDFGSDWHPEVQGCASGRFDKRTRLWSFEVKQSITRSNVRQCFFQTVSNSSWAEFGYLVAAQIDDAAKKELRVLSAAHGIGVIRLNEPKPVESEILLPAQGRPEIDWDSVNRLTQENDDFKEYVSLVRDFYQTGRTRAGEWDVPKRKSAGR